MMWKLDHLAVTCGDLDSGCAWVGERLGVALAPGGQHPTMVTHNRLLRLGDIYLEVIAPDPGAEPPRRPRWFRLDERRGGGPELTNWVVACDDLDAALAAAPEGAGEPTDLARGDYRWRMAVPRDGRLPFGEAFPALIQWQGPHPAAALPASGVTLRRLILTHPEAAALRRALAPVADPRVAVVSGPVRLRAEFDTPRGRRWLE